MASSVSSAPSTSTLTPAPSTSTPAPLSFAVWCAGAELIARPFGGGPSLVRSTRGARWSVSIINAYSPRLVAWLGVKGAAEAAGVGGYHIPAVLVDPLGVVRVYVVPGGEWGRFWAAVERAGCGEVEELDELAEAWGEVEGW